MKTQQILMTQVQNFLLQKHDIKIVLPRLFNLIDSKVNLKITPTQISSTDFNIQRSQSSQNRYKLIMNYIQNLLSSSNLDVAAVDKFMDVFLRTINTDIDILQKNQVIRGNSYRIKQKLMFRIQQITKKTNILNAAIDKIHDKSDIISFIAIDIKNYLMSMKLISEQYENVRSVQIHTPLKIDVIYQYQHSSEQDYHDHYQPMLQVLIRLRANMINLHSNVKSCHRIQIPLKSVNLLANCKNLLTQLQPFLITNQCSYNRLIFHVVTQQSQNMKLISGFYKNYLQYIKSLIYNVFKCVYLGHLFKGYYQNIQKSIQDEQTKILECIYGININMKPQQIPHIQKQIVYFSQNLQKIRVKIKSIQRIITFGQSTVMKLYLQQKICKKLQLLLKHKRELFKLRQLLGDVKKYLVQVSKLKQQLKQLDKNKTQIGKFANIFTQNLKSEDKDKQNKQILMNQHEKLTQQRHQMLFKTGFNIIQNRNITISQIQQNLLYLKNRCTSQPLINQYFPKFNQLTKGLKQQYLQLQTRLLNSYNHLLLAQQQKQVKSLQFSNKCIEEIIAYLVNEQQQFENGAVKIGMGGQIINEDSQSNKIKQCLGQLVKAQFMISSVKTRKKNQKLGNSINDKRKDSKKTNTQRLKQNFQKLQMLKKVLEWLLILFEGSMDQSILALIINKMDFGATSQPNVINKNTEKVKQLLAQLTKYNRDVRKVLKQAQIIKNKRQSEQNMSQIKEKDKQKQYKIQNVIFTKILKILKQRLILYEFIQQLYNECLSVYTDLKLPKINSKKPQSYDIQSTGITLFDKNLYTYTLICYQCLNKMQVLNKQLQDANIYPKTKNYLSDDILQPYINKLQNYLKYQQKQILNLMLRLQKAIQIQKQYKNKIKKWELIGQQINGKDKNNDLTKFKEVSQEIIVIQGQIEKILELSKKQFVILNIDELKKIQSQCEEYLDVSKQIKKIKEFTEIKVEKTYKNQKIMNIISNIHKIYQPK